MFSKKAILALAVVILLSLFVFNACAQWSPGGMAVNLGDLRLTSSAGQAGTGTYQIGTTSMNSPNMNNSSVNNSSANDRQPIKMIDLTGYARGRLNNNLTGYTNIMYPFAESRGSTTSTAGAGGCGCG